MEETEHPKYDIEDDRLFWNAKLLVGEIHSSGNHPCPKALHGLASIIESEDLRFRSESSFKERSLHNVGRIQSFVVEHIDVYRLISSRPRPSKSILCAAARLLLCCSREDEQSFDYDILEAIKECLCDETNSGGEDLKTYATGLLSVYLERHQEGDAQASTFLPPLVDFLCGRLKEANVTCIEDIEKDKQEETTREVNKFWTRVRGKGIGIWLQRRPLPEAQEQLTTTCFSPCKTGYCATEALDTDGGMNDGSLSWFHLKEAKRKLGVRLRFGAVIDSSVEAYFFVDNDTLGSLREKYCIKCFKIIGFCPQVHQVVPSEKLVDSCILLLAKLTISDALDTINLIIVLVSHEEFARLFVDRGGIQKLLVVPRDPEILYSLMELFFNIGSSPGTMERVCAHPSHVVFSMVQFMMELFRNSDPDIITTSLLFLLMGFKIKEFVDAFDTQKGLEQILSSLHDIVVTLGQYMVTESGREILLTACNVVRGYFCAHLHFLVNNIRAEETSKSLCQSSSSARKKVSKPVDISADGMETLFKQLKEDRMIGSIIGRSLKWVAVDNFLSSSGHIIMLELCSPPVGYTETEFIVNSAMSVLRIVTLVPCSHDLIVNAKLNSNRDGMAAILEAGASRILPRSQFIRKMLHILINLLVPSFSIGNTSSVIAGEDYLVPDADGGSPVDQLENALVQARESFRANGGIPTILRLFEDVKPDENFILACELLVGLARDHTFKHIFKELKVPETLLAIIESGSRDLHFGEQVKWRRKGSKVAMKLIEMITTSGCASTSVPSSAATSPLRHMEKVGIATSTRITYPAREALQLIHEYLHASGLSRAAAALLNEANLEELPSLQEPNALHHETRVQNENTLSPWPVNDPSKPNFAVEQYNHTLAISPSSSQCGNNHDAQPVHPHRATLDSILVEYVRLQHSLCTNPIETLPPVSLLNPHSCPQSTQKFEAPLNIKARIDLSRSGDDHGGFRGKCKDNAFVYSRFRCLRTCMDDASLVTCLTFLGDSSQVVTGSSVGEIKSVDCHSGAMLQWNASNTRPLFYLQSAQLDGRLLVLSSEQSLVHLWEATSFRNGPMHCFEGCQSASFSNSGGSFAALNVTSEPRKVLIYDTESYSVEMTLNDVSGVKQTYSDSLVQFSPSDQTIMWNGSLWDRRSKNLLHSFEDITEYGGGAFHPAGNEVIVNSEVWDLRNFGLLHSLYELDQTSLTFNSSGNVLYAIPRRDRTRLGSAVSASSLAHPLSSSFLTMDTSSYETIAKVSVYGRILDLAVEANDSLLGLINLDSNEPLKSSLKLYEVGALYDSDQE